MNQFTKMNQLVVYQVVWAQINTKCGFVSGHSHLLHRFAHFVQAIIVLFFCSMLTGLSLTLIWGVLLHLILASHATRFLGNQPKSDLRAPNMAEYMKPLLRSMNQPSNSVQAFENVSPECLAHLSAWGQNVAEIWSLRMLDAMSKIPEGILTGHINSFGDFDECLATRGNFSDSGVTSHFKGQYCMASVVPEHFCQPPAPPESTTEQYNVAGALLGPIFETGLYPTVAICIPSKCSKEDIQSFIIAATNRTGVCIFPTDCKTDDKPELRAGDIVMIIVLALIGALIVVGTTVDVALPDSANRPKPVQAIVAFSFYTNTRKWLNTNGGSDNLGCLHGIRFLSTCWVVLAHTWSTWIVKVWNTADLFEVYKDWTMYPILNGTVSVDTFFTISGLLVAYNVMKLLDKTKGRLNVPMFYLHRYLRLTPTYAILVGIMATWFEYLKPGPNTVELVHAGEACRKYWWHNLLYINNLVKYDFLDPSEGMCHGESWYLGNDMQFFLISPLLLLPLWKWRNIGAVVMGLFTVASIAVPFAVTYTDKLFATLIITNFDERMGDFHSKSYVKPWMRFGPYIVGMWAGYLLHLVRTRRTPVKLPAPVVILGWATSTAIALAIIFGIMPYFDPFEEYHRLGSAFYAGFHRFGWGVVISWIVLACTMGYGGFINTFLSWKVFIPLGRLSFCVYMISLWLQSLYYYSARQAISYDLYTGINHFFSHMVMSLLISFFVCMAFESPFIALEKIIFQQDKKPIATKPFAEDGGDSNHNARTSEDRGHADERSNTKV